MSGGGGVLRAGGGGGEGGDISKCGGSNSTFALASVLTKWDLLPLSDTDDSLLC